MKILHIITEIDTGGAVSLLSKLIDEKNSKEVKHVLVSLKKIKKDFNTKNIQKVYSLNIIIKPLFFLKLFELLKIIKKEKPDVIQTWMYHSNLIGGIAAKIMGIKKIYWAVLAYSVNAKIIKLSTRIIIHLNVFFSYFIPKKIVFCANSSQNTHKKIGFNEKKFIYIPIGFEHKYIQNNKSKNIFSIGCIARWDPHKDHQNLFKALKILDKKDIKYICHLIGPGMTNDNKDLQNLIDQENVERSKLSLRGYVENLDLAYKDMDVFILPSLTEAFPIVVGEAMSLGLPVIATDTGDIKKIVDQYGWVTPISNPVKLAESIFDAISKSNDNENWQIFKLNVQKQIIDNYNITSMQERYYNLWSSD